MKLKSIITAAVLYAVSFLLQGQTGVITDDQAYTSGHASTVLDVKSTSKGLLPPRMTQAQRNAISSPVSGLMIFQTDNTPGFYYYNGSAWTSLGGSASADGSETKINAGYGIAVSGTGTTGTPYNLSYQTQSVTQTERNALTGLIAGRYIWCNNCGTAGELQVYNGTSWTNMTGGTILPVLPTVTTTSVTPYTSTTGTGGGNVTSNGGETLIARGVCWNISANPTIANWKTTDGTAEGTYASSLTGLFPSTTYYVRAYATNSAGTTYGSQVSFTTNALAVGDLYQGGKVAYLFQSGDGLYKSGIQDGFITTAADISTAAPWGTSGVETYANGTALGTGWDNTNMAATYDGLAGSAPKLCYDLVSGGYSDWYLPSDEELNKLYLNRSTIGGFSSNWYWSSRQSSTTYSWYQNFSIGTRTTQNKPNTAYVRPIRSIIAIGDSFQGGIVVWIFQPGETGYVAGETHGLIVMNSDLSTAQVWGCSGVTISGADGTAIGTGNQNMIDILAGCGGSTAASDCNNYTNGDLGTGSYSDWYLPSKDELNKVWVYRSYVGTLSSTAYYLSSTESSSTQAWGQQIGASGGNQAVIAKGTAYRVRAMRNF